MDDVQVGDRVLVSGAWLGTVVEIRRTWMPYVIVDMDHDQGRTAVYPTYVERVWGA